MDHGAIAKYVASLRASPETEVVFSALESAVARAASDLAARRRGAPVPPLQNGLAAAVRGAADALLSTSYYASLPRPALAAIRRQLLQALESAVMEPLHDELLAALEDELAPQCIALRDALSALSDCTQEELGVKAAFRVRHDSVVAMLGLITVSVTPLEKLHCLRDTTTTLMRCLEQELERAGKDLADVDLATDDILDILLHVLIAGREHHRTWALPAHLAFIERFHFVDDIDGGGYGYGAEPSRLMYYVANFAQAVGFFLEGRGAEMVAAEQEEAAEAAAQAALARANAAARAIVEADYASAKSATEQRAGPATSVDGASHASGESKPVDGSPP